MILGFCPFTRSLHPKLESPKRILQKGLTMFGKPIIPKGPCSYIVDT